jgi:hypothetical protein
MMEGRLQTGWFTPVCKKYPSLPGRCFRNGACRQKVMAWKALSLCSAVALMGAAAFAQPSRAPADGERPPRPNSASNARVGGWCDALTGEKKEQCLREESRKLPDRSAKGDLGGTCDALLGPDKERCLRQGGTVEVDAKPDARATAREAAASQ